MNNINKGEQEYIVKAGVTEASNETNAIHERLNNFNRRLFEINEMLYNSINEYDRIKNHSLNPYQLCVDECSNEAQEEPSKKEKINDRLSSIDDKIYTIYELVLHVQNII